MICCFASGCTCHIERFKPIAVEQPRDKSMTCKELDYEIGSIKVELDSLERKYNSIIAYANSPLCIPQANFALLKTQEDLTTRLERIRHLYNFKQCYQRGGQMLGDTTLQKVNINN